MLGEDNPVMIYRDANYGGTRSKLTYNREGSVHNMDAVGMGIDEVSSIKVAPLTKVTLFDQRGGLRPIGTLVGPAEIPDLGPRGWDDRTNSIRVERDMPSNNTILGCCAGTISGPACGWLKPGSQSCTRRMQSYCPLNMGNAACQAYCRDNREWCDEHARKWCAEVAPNGGRGTPFCSCINSKAISAKSVNPKCVDARCLADGYFTANMANTACPDIIDCKMIVDLRNSGVTIGGAAAKFEQRCGAGNSPATTSISRDVLSGAGDSGGAASNTRASPSAPVMIFLVFLLVLVAALSAVFLAYDDSPAQPG